MRRSEGGVEKKKLQKAAKIAETLKTHKKGGSKRLAQKPIPSTNRTGMFTYSCSS